jgi:hypothetical protein
LIDILLYESGNGGEISLKNGDIQMTDSISNQPYLAHFGGNVEASTTGEEITGEDRSDWWGNAFFENDQASQMNSELERALNNTALNSSGRLSIIQSAKTDLQFLKEIADIDCEASIIGIDKISISDKINQTQKTFTWDATNDELIEEITI